MDSFFREHKLRTLTDSKVPVDLRTMLCEIVSEVLEKMSEHVEIGQLIDVRDGGITDDW